jgi:hypothetical protein
MQVIYILTFLLNHSLYLKKQHQNPLGSLKEPNKHVDRQREATLFYITLWYLRMILCVTAFLVRPLGSLWSVIVITQNTNRVCLIVMKECP